MKTHVVGLLASFDCHFEVSFALCFDQNILFFYHVSDFSINVFVSVRDLGTIVGPTHTFVWLQQNLV